MLKIASWRCSMSKEIHIEACKKFKKKIKNFDFEDDTVFGFEGKGE